MNYLTDRIVCGNCGKQNSPANRDCHNCFIKLPEID